MTNLAMSAPIHLSRIVAVALEEDLGRGDITTDACVPPSVMGRCAFRARSALVSAGGAVIVEVFAQLDRNVSVSDLVPDGTALAPGAVSTVKIDGSGWSNRIAPTGE